MKKGSFHAKKIMSVSQQAKKNKKTSWIRQKKMWERELNQRKETNKGNYRF